MQNRLIPLLLAVLLCAGALSACGSAPAPAAPAASASDLTPAPTPAPAPTPTPTPTPAPTSAPVPETKWIDDHPLSFTAPGAFRFAVDLSDMVNYKGSLFTPEEVSDLSTDGEVALSQRSGADGSKTITASYTLTPCYLTRSENGVQGHVQGLGLPMYGYFDLTTGEALAFCDMDDACTETLETVCKGERVALTVTHRIVQERTSGDGGVQPLIAEVSVTCPADYDGAAFFFQSGAEESAFVPVSGGFLCSYDPGAGDVLFFRGE